MVYTDPGGQRVAAIGNPPGQCQSAAGAGGRVGLGQWWVTGVFVLSGDCLLGLLQPFVQCSPLFSGRRDGLLVLGASGPVLLSSICCDCGFRLAQQRQAMQSSRLQRVLRSLLGGGLSQPVLVGGNACLQAGQRRTGRLVLFPGGELVELGLSTVRRGRFRRHGLRHRELGVQSPGQDRIKLGGRVISPD